MNGHNNIVSNRIIANEAKSESPTQSDMLSKVFVSTVT